jgi:4'-phosphopantetheinyl transferase EntD
MDLSSLFPGFVKTALVEVGRVDGPMPEEAALVAGATERRRRTFAAGREAAHRALRMLGGPEGAILRLPGGAPAWPSGVVGSIAHTDRLAAAAVAWRRDAVAVGLDLEILANVREEFARHILAAAEFETWSRCPADLRATELAIRFSAKEAAIKCLAGTGRPPPGLRDLVVGLEDPGGGFQVRSAGGADAAPALVGRRLVDTAAGHVATAIVEVARGC